MEFTSVDLNGEEQQQSSPAVSKDAHTITTENGTNAISSVTKDASGQGSHEGVRESAGTSQQTSSDLDNSNKIRQPRTLSVNGNPNPLAARRGSSVKPTLSPKTSESDMNAENSDYQARLKQLLEAEVSEQPPEQPSVSEYEDKPRPPRAISMSGTAVNPLTKRRGSSIRPGFTQAHPVENEETVPVHPGMPSIPSPTQPPPPMPMSPPPPPAPPSEGEEDMVRPSMSLSFGGLYDVRPSMIETEYVADMRPESPPPRMPAIRESEDDHHEGRFTNEDDLDDTIEGVYNTRLSTIDIPQRPVSPPVPPTPPPMSSPPPVPITPPVVDTHVETELPQPVYAPPPPLPVAVSKSDNDLTHPLADVENNNKIRMSYASDDEESPAHPAQYVKQPNSASHLTPSTPMATPLVYKDVKPKASDVYLAGIGWKLCPSVAVVWQERYFVLKNDGSIHYYTNKASFMCSFAPRGVIVINDIQRVKGGVYIELLQNKLNIGVHSKNSRIYKLKFGTAEEAAKWKDAIYRFVK